MKIKSDLAKCLYDDTVIKVKLIFAFIFLNMKLKIGLFILTKLNKMLSLSKRLNMIPYNTQLNCFSQKW